MKNIELKIYEFLGIKHFKKFVLALEFISPEFIKMSKEEIKKIINRKIIYRHGGNYHLDKGHDVKNLHNFKKYLLFNAATHLYSLYCCISFLTYKINFLVLLILILNLYCIMLQRYNHIRINSAIKKCSVIENKKKDSIIEEIEKEEPAIKDFTYRILKENWKEKQIDFDKFINIATLNQLKEYKFNIEKHQRLIDREKENASLKNIVISMELITENIYIEAIKPKTKSKKIY